MKNIAILSPHLDDGILSCGEYAVQNVRKGNIVTIITFFSGYPNASDMSEAAKTYHSNCFLEDDAMEYRKQEDINACRSIGCKYIHLNLYECLYRKTSQDQYLYPDLNNIYHYNSDDFAIVDRIKAITCEIVDKYDEVLAPLGLGNHADHLVINKAISELDSSPKANILYYAEIPYLCYMLEKSDRVFIEDKSSVTIPITYDEWNTKIHAIMFYRSQLHIMWKNYFEMQRQLKNAALTYTPPQMSLRLWR